MVDATIIGVLAGFLSLVLVIAKAIIGKEADRKKKEEQVDKEIHDAIASGDIGRVHSIIDRMRK